MSASNAGVGFVGMRGRGLIKAMAVAAAAGMLAACSGSDGDGGVGAVASGNTVANAGGDLAAKYVGTYASLSRSASAGNVPVVGKIRTVATVLGLVEIKQTASGPITVERGCHVETSGGPSVTIADSVPRSMAPIEAPITFVRDPASGAVRFERAQSFSVIGANLENPSSDALPESPDDPRVVDQDGDGKPGITANVKAALFVKGDIYLAQRVQNASDGVVDERGVFRGTTRTVTEQVVLGASNALFKVSIAMSPEDGAPENTVTLVPVDAAMTCDEVVSQRDTLFNP